MKKTIIALQPHELGQIIDYVHDRSYDLDCVEFDRQNQKLRIPIRLNKKGLEGILFVLKVTDYKISDEAEIGEGDINTIEYKDGQVLIRGAIPVNINIEVDDLRLELMLPDDAPLA